MNKKKLDIIYKKSMKDDPLLKVLKGAMRSYYLMGMKSMYDEIKYKLQG